MRAGTILVPRNSPELIAWPLSREITAWTAENEIMGLKHKAHPVHGVQFHPEWILTEEGKTMLKNFLEF